MRFSIFLSVSIALFVLGCNSGNVEQAKPGFTVKASIESTPVQSAGDAADDPAIWLHPSKKEKSLIFGTDKQSGIYAYGLDGKKKAYYPLGNINNIDVGYGYMLDSQLVDILVATNKSSNTLEIYTISPKNGLLRTITSEPIYSTVSGVYGICTYKSREDSQMYVFLSGKDGMIEQWKIIEQADQLVTASRVRKIQMESVCEGLVADEELGFVYAAEENQAIWRLYAHPDSSDDYFLVASIEGNENLTAEIEGLALYTASNEEGFLIASSQGNSSFAVFKRKAPYPYLGSFHISNGEHTDETSATDGIAVLNVNLGKDFPKGIFVAQDDRNLNAEGKLENQNFKFVRWEQIADSLGSAGIVDTKNFVR
ncbi:MAG: phytase [Bacteroidia bacterium]|nr:phytase [Bacteroidia bacterium]